MEQWEFFNATAERYRRRAEQTRVILATFSDKTIRITLIRVASEYDQMAAQMDKLAAQLRKGTT